MLFANVTLIYIYKDTRDNKIILKEFKYKSHKRLIGAKQSHGHPKVTVLTLSKSFPPSEIQPEVKTENIDEDEGSTSEKRESGSNKRGSTNETLKSKTMAEPESRRLWVNVISNNRNPAKEDLCSMLL